MILHVGSPSVFIGPFRKLVRSEFPHQDHQFWLSASDEHFEIGDDKDVCLAKKHFLGRCKAHAKLIFQMHSAKKVVLHGLFNSEIILLLTLMPWLAPKCYWVIWGGDLYRYRRARNSWQSRFLELLRRFVIRRIGHLVTYIDGDIALARKWYRAEGIHHECIMYLSNVFDSRFDAEFNACAAGSELRILLGNSADPSNKHIEALERLLPFRDHNIKIFSPLSYGSESYASELITTGKAWFGEKFVPIRHFMPFEKYLDFLKTIDIAVFNHDRQQGMGNTINLLGMGKTVYIRSGVSQWELFEKEGISVLDISTIDLRLLDHRAAVSNRATIKKQFSRDRLVEQYARIFDS